MSLQVFVLVAVVGVALGAEPFIIGGRPAQRGSWPWLLSIHRWREDEGVFRHSCGAALITAKWVLTAAHCTTRNKEEYRIQVGAWRQSAHDQVDSLRVVQIINHEDYVEGPGYPNDISLMELERAVDLNNPMVGLLKLPRYGDEFAGNPDCWVAGWGRINNHPDNWTSADTLMEVNTAIHSLADCRKIWMDFLNSTQTNILDTHICVGKPDLGACHGDSGSPAVCDITGRGDWTAAGLNSWGTGSHCSAATNAFTRITSYLDWIRSKVSGLPGSKPPQV